MDFFNDWLSWSNMFYLIGLIVAGYATTVTAKNRQITPRTTLSNEGNKSKIRPVSISDI